MVRFLRHILDDARSRRPGREGRYTVDDLRVALGVSRSGEQNGNGRHAGEQNGNGTTQRGDH